MKYDEYLEDGSFSPDMVPFLEELYFGTEKSIPTSKVEASHFEKEIYKSTIRLEGHLLFDRLRKESDFFTVSKESDPELAELYSSPNIAFEYHPDPTIKEDIHEKIWSIFEECQRYDPLTIMEEVGCTVENCYEFLYQLSSLERFLHTKFLGQKRFSIEGSESTLLILAILRDLFFSQKKSLTVGMTHRGRIVAMVMVCNKPLHELFHEFLHTEDHTFPPMGDVKYHTGYGYIDAKTECSCTLLPNPSHLESVYPVVIGRTRREQDMHGVESHRAIVCHGDASISGQGVVYETLQMEKLEAYTVGGAVHVVIDNQVGFTASAEESRSTARPTDIFTTFSIPVIHVTESSPIDCVRAALIAFRIREECGRDVAIRLLGTRKYGHNEMDDPTITQPKLYQQIQKEYKPAYEFLRDQVIELLSDVALDNLHKKCKTLLQNEYQKAIDTTSFKKNGIKKSEEIQVEVCSAQELLTNIQSAINGVENFHFHPQARSFLEKRVELLKTDLEKTRLDWSFAEMIAYILLLKRGHIVRLTGQDVERGTFSQRHAIYIDQITEEEWSLLSTFGQFYVYNSHLSEYGALGFEYGYSLQNSPQAIPLWEAQFGDFINGAQIIIDQYISSGFEKWGSTSNLVLLLPHGYEGQGPEHSSCRLERFLSLFHESNMVIAAPSFPDTYVKLLLRQGNKTPCTPLVVLSPKALLRDPKTTSTLEECLNPTLVSLREMHVTSGDKDRIRVVILSTGKFAHEVSEYIQELKPFAPFVAVYTCEIIAPFPDSELNRVIQSYKNLQAIIWAQEEPKNMGACQFVMQKLFDSGITTKQKMHYVARDESASPATGYLEVHLQEIKNIQKNIFEILTRYIQ